jgi:HlyD family secretion protein
MRRWLKWFLIVLVVGGTVAFGAAGHGWWQQRNATKYVTVNVTRGRVETVVNSTGTVKAVRTVTVGAFTSGPIKAIFVDHNAEITEKEMVLALIDDRLQQAALDRDRAALASQQAELTRNLALVEQARRAEKRVELLRKVNTQYTSDTEVDQAKYDTLVKAAQVESAKASIRLAQANLKNSEEQLGYTKILGPKEIDPIMGIKGKVIDRKVEPGQTVAAQYQTPELFTIALEMDRHMHVFANVDEADIGMIRAGKDRDLAVQFTVDTYPREVFPGRILEVRLNSTTTQNVVTYPVVIDAPNLEQKLKPGMTANITFPIETKENVLRVPAVALRFTPLPAQVRPEDRHYLESLANIPNNSVMKRSAGEKATLAQARRRRTVWVQDGDLLKAVPITLGLTENQFAEVLDGELTDGQAIVIGTEGILNARQ